MEAIILAGGYGTRLRPLTYTWAKSLLPILNKPMISYLIDSLPKEVNKVILAVNYKKKQIEEYFKRQNFNIDIIVNHEQKPLGTGGAVKFAQKHITDRFFVLNGDIICSINLEEMIKFHDDNKSISTISLWPVTNVSEFGVADVKGNGNIVGFVEKPRQEDAPSNLINAGAYLLEPEILDYIKEDRLVSMEKEIFPQIIKDTGKFFGFKFYGYWMDIGRISSYIKVHKFLLKKKNIDNYLGQNCDIKGELQNSCLGNNIYIGYNVKLDSSIVYDGSTIEENTILRNCVIAKNCLIGNGSKLKDVVLGDNEYIEKNSSINNRIVWTQPIPEGYPKKQIGNVIEK